MSDPCGGLSARELHVRLQEALAELRRAEKSAVLIFAEIQERRLYRELGHSSIFQYAELALGFSRNKTYQFLRLAESFSRLQKLKGAVSKGELSWTKARELSKVATRGSEERWIREAKASSSRELERKVMAVRSARREKPVSQATLLDDPAQRRVRDRAVAELPVKLSLSFTPEQFARLEVLLESMQKKDAMGSREELILSALNMAVEQAEESREEGARDLPRSKTVSPRQIVLYKCESCGGVGVQTSRGLLPLGAAAVAAAECDARVLEPGKRSRSTIPPATRRAVLARDEHRCRAKGCGRTRFLELHHVLPRARGGSNRPENLVTLCSACHRLLHERGLVGEEPGGFVSADAAHPG